MVDSEPGHAEQVLADLLVGGEREQQVAGRPYALPGERGEGHGRRRDVALHVERPTTPDLAVDEVARPRVAFPLVWVGEDSVRVRHQEQARPVATGQARDEVGAIRRPREELARNAVPGEVVAEQLRGPRLVAGRVDRVEPDELLQELGDLLAEGQADSALDRAVSSLRTSQSSGKTTVWTRRPSTSTGVPCVPTTLSPITRATTR